MVLERLGRVSVPLFATCCLALLPGCPESTEKHFTRMHLENACDAPVTFLAIGTSEDALETAENRLSHPLPPRSVYSAVLSRPGNYWVRAEVETDGYTIERIEGPVRLSRGVLNWQFKKVDSRPLYSEHASPAQGAFRLSDAATTYPPAGRMSLSSN